MSDARNRKHLARVFRLNNLCRMLILRSHCRHICTISNTNTIRRICGYIRDVKFAALWDVSPYSLVQIAHFLDDSVFAIFNAESGFALL